MVLPTKSGLRPEAEDKSAFLTCSQKILQVELDQLSLVPKVSVLKSRHHLKTVQPCRLLYFLEAFADRAG